MARIQQMETETHVSEQFISHLIENVHEVVQNTEDIILKRKSKSPVEPNVSAPIS